MFCFVCGWVFFLSFLFLFCFVSVLVACVWVFYLGQIEAIINTGRQMTHRSFDVLVFYFGVGGCCFG